MGGPAGRRGRWSGLPLSLGGPPRQAAAQPPRSLHLPQAALPCGPHRPAPATGWSVRRGRSDGAAKRTRDARPYGGIAAPIRSAKAYWRCWFVCLRRGTFRAVRSSQNAPGAAAPDPFGAVRRTSQGEASPRPLRSTGPSRSILPAPSRLRAGQENRTIVTATELSSKAARTAPEQEVDAAHGSFYAQILPSML